MNRIFVKNACGNQIKVRSLFGLSLCAHENSALQSKFLVRSPPITLYLSVCLSASSVFFCMYTPIERRENVHAYTLWIGILHIWMVWLDSFAKLPEFLDLERLHSWGIQILRLWCHCLQFSEQVYRIHKSIRQKNDELQMSSQMLRSNNLCFF